jgi:hypothetical protein
MATWLQSCPILWLATLVTAAVHVRAGTESTPAGWLYTQRGTGYGVKDVGLVVYDFQGNLIVVGRARNLKNLKGHYEPPPLTVAAPQDVVWAKYTRDERPITFVKLGEVDAPGFSQLVADRNGSIFGLAWFDKNIRFFTNLGVRSFANRSGGGML